MEKSEFCARVLARVRHATAEERAAIQAELEGHLEDHAEDLMRIGYPAAEAADRAMAAMGDPEEIGKALNREYPLGWLVLSRVALAATVLLCLVAVLDFPILGHVFDNLQARTAPKTAPFRSEIGAGGVVLRDLDIRVPMGNDVLYIYQVGLAAGEGDGAVKAYLAMCNYDRNPFGTASDRLQGQLRFTTSAAADRIDRYGSGGGGNSGAWYGVVCGIPAARADEALLLTYDAFGEQAEIWVPLPWEELK